MRPVRAEPRSPNPRCQSVAACLLSSARSLERALQSYYLNESRSSYLRNRNATAGSLTCVDHKSTPAVTPQDSWDAEVPDLPDGNRRDSELEATRARHSRYSSFPVLRP